MQQTSFRHSKTKWTLAFVFAASAVLITVAGLHNAGASYVEDCKSNSIITCGIPTSDAFITKVRADNDGHGHQDLQAVYSDFGLVPSDYSKFVSYARPGMAYQNGTVVVDGQTVATDAWSIGRTRFSYTTPMSIDGHTYYKANDKQVLLQNLPVMVLFNSKGQMQFAVMNACGNPVKGQNVVPTYSCDLLQMKAVSGESNTYTFTTKATATNNAKLVKAVYTFGDGTSQTVIDLSTPVKHSYGSDTCNTNGAATCSARVTVYVSVPGSQTVTTTSATCEKQITINVPPPSPTPPPAPTPPSTTTTVSTPPPVMPSTGAGGIAGLFIGTTAVGYTGYRIVARRRLSRSL